MHKFDLEKRTLIFTKNVINLCKRLPKNSMNSRLVGQIVGSAGSIGANYREANDCLGGKDFVLRLKIARKEAKETTYWLKLIEEANDGIHSDIEKLLKESIELTNILSTIIKKFNLD